MKKKTGYLYYLVVFIFIVLTLGPIIWSFIVSLTSESEMFKNTQEFLPSSYTFDNYKSLFESSNRYSKLFRNGMVNSLKACAVTIALGIPVAVLAAYALSRTRFRGRKIVRNALLITMVIPVFTTIIPLYKIFSDFGFLDNIFWLTVVYVSALLPMTTWVISTYFDTIPVELEEAAALDGYGKMQTLIHIILPISYTIIFAAILIIFLMTWNQFQIPLILASSKATKPLSMVMSEFTTKDSVKYGLTAAAGILAILPPALVALVFRKFLVSGLTGGSVKG